MTPTRFIIVASFLVSLGLSLGCSSAPEAPAPQFTVLRDVDGMLRMANGRKMTKAQELTQLENNFPSGVHAVKSGEVVVNWGVKMANEDGSGATSEVAAYEKKVPTEGGYVLFQDGNIKKLSAPEFEKLPKPKQ